MSFEKSTLKMLPPDWLTVLRWTNQFSARNDLEKLPFRNTICRPLVFMVTLVIINLSKKTDLFSVEKTLKTKLEMVFDGERSWKQADRSARRRFKPSGNAVLLSDCSLQLACSVFTHTRDLSRSGNEWLRSTTHENGKFATPPLNCHTPSTSVTSECWHRHHARRAFSSRGEASRRLRLCRHVPGEIAQRNAAPRSSPTPTPGAAPYCLREAEPADPQPKGKCRLYVSARG